MLDFHALLVPLGVLAVLLLFRFVGCDFGGPSAMIVQPYADDVLQDNPVVYYRLQELPGATVAHDEKGLVDARYGIADGVHTLPLLSGAEAATYRSQPIASPSQELGAPSILPRNPNETSVRFNGSFVSTAGQVSLGDLPRFNVDALARPEWDLLTERNFYCVIDYSNFVPGLGAPGPGRNAGFAVYAGPDNPFDPASPICWQLWIGSGREFLRANPVDGGPGPLVSAEDTYVAVQFGDNKACLWAYTVHADMDQVKFEVIRRPYVQAQDTATGKPALRIGISNSFASLIPPFPSPQGLIYPFVGRLAELAIYNSVLDGGRLMSHIMNAFNTA